MTWRDCYVVLAVLSYDISNGHRGLKRDVIWLKGATMVNGKTQPAHVLDVPTSHIFPPTERRVLPSHDGTIVINPTSQPIRYHISRCFIGEPTDTNCNALMLTACRIACMSADVIRGRLSASVLQRNLSPTCLQRLETMAYLMDNHMNTHEDLRAQLCYLPAIPHWLNGMLISPITVEFAVHLTIGKLRYWATLVLRYSGSRWICTTADLG